MAVLPLVLGACDDDEGGGGEDPLANDPNTDISEAPAAGNPDGGCTVPDAGAEADVSGSKNVVGDGSPDSCTSDAVIEAVAKGGKITFDCGPDPVRILLEETAKIVNDTGPTIVIDGGNKVTLSGAGGRRILYMNTCDQNQKLTTVRCEDQDHPRLTVQNITFVDGDTRGDETDGGGGGAIFARGGRLKVVNSRFFSNRAGYQGESMSGGAIRAFDQHDDKKVWIVNSTFGHQYIGNTASNGGAIGGAGTNYAIYNSRFHDNRATGEGGSMPRRDETRGGGYGGAVFVDGEFESLELCGVLMEDNEADEGAGAVFFRSLDEMATLVIEQSEMRRNWTDDENPDALPSDPMMPGIIAQTADGNVTVTDSVIEEGMEEMQ